MWSGNPAQNSKSDQQPTSISVLAWQSQVFAESTQAMGCERFAKSKFVDDETVHSGDESDLDAPLGKLALRDLEEAK